MRDHYRYDELCREFQEMFDEPPPPEFSCTDLETAMREYVSPPDHARKNAMDREEAQ